MDLRFYEEKLYSLEDFKKFRNENPEAYLCSVFIMIDKENKSKKIHFDYFISETGKMISFQLESENKMIPMDNFSGKAPEKLSLSYNIDFEDIERLIAKKMESENVKNKIQKILLSLQKLNGKDFLSGTVFISMMGMLKVAISVEEKKVTEFEKKSMFDILKVTKGKN